MSTDMIQQERHILSVVFSPKVHNLGPIMKETQTEEHSTKYLTTNLQKFGQVQKRVRNYHKLEETKEINKCNMVS